MDHIGGIPLDHLALPSYSEAKRILNTLQLPYQLGRNTLESSNIHQTDSFFLALVDQLSDPEIRMTISARAREFYKTPLDENKLANDFRSAIVEYCCREFTHNTTWSEMQGYKFLDVMYDSFPNLIISEMTESGEKIYRCGSCHAYFMDRDDTKGVDTFAGHIVHCCSLNIDKAWAHLVGKMKHQYKFPATEIFIRAAALFLEKDILIIEEGASYRIPGALKGVSKNPPMAMVHMYRTKFQSALRKLESGCTSDTKHVAQGDQIVICRGCNSKVQQINKHLAKKPECKIFFSKDELALDSKEKRKASKQSYYEAHKNDKKKAILADNVDSEFICHLCNEKEFSSQEHLDRHIEKVHVKFAKHICSICKEQFSREDSLARHVKDIHKAEKSFKCPECPLTFARRDTLNKHVSRATDHPEKHGISFHCNDCGKDIVFSSPAAYSLKCKKGKACDCQPRKK